ncbi:hypothetical protein Esti_000066 [Eimeria stiedai]
MATERGPQRTPSGDLLLQEDESLGIKVQNISLFIRGQSAGRGVLFVTSERVAWLSESGPSFALNYLSIVLHGLSSETGCMDGFIFVELMSLNLGSCVFLLLLEGGEKPYLYCQVKGEALSALTNGHLAPGLEGGSHEEESSNDDEPMAELKFVPDDSSCLKRLFTVLSEIAASQLEETAHLNGDEEEIFDDAALRRQVAFLCLRSL